MAPESVAEPLKWCVCGDSFSTHDRGGSCWMCGCREFEQRVAAKHVRRPEYHFRYTGD